MKRSLRLVALLSVLPVLMAGCGHHATSTSIATTVAGFEVTIAPACAVLDGGRSLQFTATAHPPLANPASSWGTSDPLRATVDSDGVVTALDGGNVWITATIGGKAGRALLFVNPIPAVHNCRPYEWYQTQMNTGPASDHNCGPASSRMAISWYRGSRTSVPSVQEIRNLHYNEGRWWSVSDIIDTLEHHGVPFATHPVENEQSLRSCLQRGRIILLCVEMGWITYDRHPFYHRFYDYDGGHFLVVKGYSQDGAYFVVYDPNSFINGLYSDGTFMGRNRFYSSSELVQAATHWWAFFMEIGAPPAQSTIWPTVVPPGRAGPRDLL